MAMKQNIVSSASHQPNVIDVCSLNTKQKITPKKTAEIIVIDDDVHTPPSQLQKVYDLSKESAKATYEWMRCVHLHITHV